MMNNCLIKGCERPRYAVVMTSQSFPKPMCKVHYEQMIALREINMAETFSKMADSIRDTFQAVVSDLGEAITNIGESLSHYFPDEYDELSLEPPLNPDYEIFTDSKTIPYLPAGPTIKPLPFVFEGSVEIEDA